MHSTTRKSSAQLQIRVLDGDALRALCAEPNSSKYAIDAHNRAVEEIGDLSTLPKLCSLDLSFNCIKTLTNLGTARELRELKLYNNWLTTTKGLRANGNLEGLFLSENQITTISSDLLALGKLKVLGLKGNRIERVEHLKSCRLLVSLDLSRNRLSGTAAEGLETLVCLEMLNLSDNQLRAVGNLSHLVKLEDLNLSSNKLTTLDGQFPPSLVTLRVNGNELTSLESLSAPLPTLNELYIHDNALSDLEAIALRCPALESLDIRNNRVRSAMQLQALGAVNHALHDLWVTGNPCCASSSYVLDIIAALPALKTLDDLSDAHLVSYIDGLNNGSIVATARGSVTTSRPFTPSSSRPGTATSSRPGSSSSSSGLASRPTTSSGRPGTPDGLSAPVFHKPSARTGTLMKLVPAAEIERAQSDVSERLQKMKAMLQRVGSSADSIAIVDNEPVHRQTTSSSNAARTTGSRGRSRTKQLEKQQQEQLRVEPFPTNATVLSSPLVPETPGPTAAQVLRDGVAAVTATTTAAPDDIAASKSTAPPQPQTLVHKPRRKPVQCDAGTDPLDSVMGSNNAHIAEWLATPIGAPPPAQASQRRSTDRVAHEIETQTHLPPAPITMAPSSLLSSLVGVDTAANITSDALAPSSSLKRMQLEPEPHIDGDVIEHEMKTFLLQFTPRQDDPNDDRSGDNNNSNTDYSSKRQKSDAIVDADGVGGENQASEYIEVSPRIESIKTAEQRAAPTLRSRQGYRSFRMPASTASRPNSSRAS